MAPIEKGFLYYLVIGSPWLYVMASVIILSLGVSRKNSKYVRMGSAMLAAFCFLLSVWVLMAALFVGGYEPNALLYSYWIVLAVTVIGTVYFGVATKTGELWPINRLKSDK